MELKLDTEYFTPLHQAFLGWVMENNIEVRLIANDQPEGLPSWQNNILTVLCFIYGPLTHQGVTRTGKVMEKVGEGEPYHCQNGHIHQQEEWRPKREIRSFIALVPPPKELFM